MWSLPCLPAVGYFVLRSRQRSKWWHLLQHGCNIETLVSRIIVSIQDAKVMEDG